MWFFNQLEPDSPLYNLPVGPLGMSSRPCACRWIGRLNVLALERSLTEIVRRHEVLRTRFPLTAAGVVQEVLPARPIRLQVEDLSGLDRADGEAAARERVLSELRRPFLLAEETPLRAALLRIDTDDHVLIPVVHHIAFDRWSRGVMLRELAQLYSEYAQAGVSPLPEPELQYREYALQQREQIDGAAMKASLAYWREQLRDIPDRLELPCDRPRPAFPSYQGDYCSLPLSPELIQKLEALARSERASLSMVLVTGFQALLAELTGQTDVSLGLEVAGRTRLELEHLIGCFTNTLVLRTNLSGEPSFRSVLRQVRAATLAGYSHQDLPFEKLVEELRPRRDTAHHPFYQVLFNYLDLPGRSVEIPGVQIGDFKIDRKIALVDLAVDVERTAQGTTCYFTYSTDLFDRSRVARMVADYRALLEAAAAAPDLPLSGLAPGANQTDPTETERLLSQLELMSDEEAQHALTGERPHSAGAASRVSGPDEHPPAELHPPITRTDKGKPMERPENLRPVMRKPTPMARKGITVSQEDLVTLTPMRAQGSLPVVVEPKQEGLDLERWAEANRDLVQRQVSSAGGILFRNFGLKSEAELEGFIRALSGEPLEYTYRSTPRKQVAGKVYTSTEYPPDQFIPLHNEMSYTRNWPMKIWFLCLKAAQEGGETPIADSRRVYERIDPRIRDRFAEKQLMYVRTYGTRVDLPWQEVFQTTDKNAVEDYCRHAGIEFTWTEDNGLRTRQVCQAVATHPQTGEVVWFNQAHLFHVSSLPSAIRETLLSTYTEDKLPRNVYYGDGTPIEAQDLDAIREAYRQETITFPWREGDVLMLDNMLAAHGRTPFVGARKVVVGMAEAFSA